MTLEAFLPELMVGGAAAVICFAAWFYITRKHAKLGRRDRERAARR